MHCTVTSIYTCELHSNLRTRLAQEIVVTAVQSPIKELNSIRGMDTFRYSVSDTPYLKQDTPWIGKCLSYLAKELNERVDGPHCQISGSATVKEVISSQAYPLDTILTNLQPEGLG